MDLVLDDKNIARINRGEEDFLKVCKRRCFKAKVESWETHRSRHLGDGHQILSGALILSGSSTSQGEGQVVFVSCICNSRPVSRRRVKRGKPHGEADWATLGHREPKTNPTGCFNWQPHGILGLERFSER